MGLRVLLLCCLAISFTSCRQPQSPKVQKPPFRNVIQPPKLSRQNLITISNHGYKPLRARKYYFDIGVKETRDQCRLIEPRKGTYPAGKRWAPLDVYQNVLNEDDQKAFEDALGEADIFYVGDDANRCGKETPHDWTMQPDKVVQSMDFLNGHYLSRRGMPVNSEYQLTLKFTRGDLTYRNEILIRAYKDDDGECAARAYLCTDWNEEKNRCDEWGYIVKRVKIIIDMKGARNDYFYSLVHGEKDEKDKNDIKRLDAIVIEADKDGKPVGEEEEITLSEKE